MNEITPELIAELRELASNATPRPWFLEPEMHTAINSEKKHIALVSCFNSWDSPMTDEEHKANAGLIATATNHLPALLDEIERLQAEIIGEGKVLAQKEELIALCEARQARIAELEAEHEDDIGTLLDSITELEKPFPRVYKMPDEIFEQQKPPPKLWSKNTLPESEE